MVWEDYLYYDETSPSCLRWKRETYRGANKQINRRVGDVAGSLTEKGYWRVHVCGVNMFCHRIIWVLHGGNLVDRYQIDHINGIRSDNTIGNLRLVNASVNARNRKSGKTTVSMFCGVTLVEHKRDGVFWRARWVTIKGTRNSKDFYVAKHGYDEAFRLACEYRAKMIEELNAQGAGYTERHGH